MANSRVVITGYGICSAIGMNATENLYSLQQGLHGISQIENFPTHHREHLPAGEVKYTNKVLKMLSGVAFEPAPRSVLLSLPAIREALVMSASEGHEIDGFIYGTTVGGIDLSEDEMYRYFNKETVNYSAFSTHDDGRSAELISTHFGFQTPGQTISTACSSAANAIMTAAEYILAGRKSRIMAGGADALCRFTLNGFNSLMILDKQHCQPFDVDRRGLNLGEGSAYLVLESEETALQRGATVIAYLTGWANRNDAHHQTASSDEGRGARLAMLEALKMARLRPEAISHINAHGTATLNNDSSEGAALLAVFEQIPPFTSTKSYTGHTLAASGGLEAVFALFSLQNQEIYPTLRFNAPIAKQLVPVTEYQSQEIQHVLSNSFGFGGNCSTLIFTKA